LNDEEKENRRATFQDVEDERIETETAALSLDAEIYFKKETTGRIQHVLDIKQKERNLSI